MKLLATYADDNGTSKTAMMSVDQEDLENGYLQFGELVAALPDCNTASNVTFVEVPAEFRPVVYDQDGEEIGMVFIDL